MNRFNIFKLEKQTRRFGQVNENEESMAGPFCLKEAVFIIAK
jgi:hypothetical protein